MVEMTPERAQVILAQWERAGLSNLSTPTALRAYLTERAARVAAEQERDAYREMHDMHPGMCCGKCAMEIAEARRERDEAQAKLLQRDLQHLQSLAGSREHPLCTAYRLAQLAYSERGGADLAGEVDRALILWQSAGCPEEIADDPDAVAAVIQERDEARAALRLARETLAYVRGYVCDRGLSAEADVDEALAAIDRCLSEVPDAD